MYNKFFLNKTPSFVKKNIVKLKGLKFAGANGFSRNIQHITMYTTSSSGRQYHVVIIYFINECFERNHETVFSNTLKLI
jgi:hypothetical protein